MNEDFIYSLSYNQILSFSEPERSKLMDFFNKALLEVDDSVYSRNRSLGEMLLETSMYEDMCEYDNISEYVFPGKRVLYYPNIKIVKAHKDYLCAVSGCILKSGSEIISWKPFFWLPDLNVSYVLSKAIRCDIYYEDFLPKDIESFDDFYFKLEHSYELDLDEYYNFYTNIHGAFSLRKLKR